MSDPKSSKSEPQPNAPQSLDCKMRKKWELQETIKYCEFVKAYRQTLQYPQKKQKQRIYNKMAGYIGTRTTHQCRSHHQKVIKRYGTIQEFLKKFTDKISSVPPLPENPYNNMGIGGPSKIQQNVKNMDEQQFKRDINSKQNQIRYYPGVNTSMIHPNQYKSEFFRNYSSSFQCYAQQASFPGYYGLYEKSDPTSYRDFVRNDGSFRSQSLGKYKSNYFFPFHVPSSSNRAMTASDNDNNPFQPKSRGKTSSVNNGGFVKYDDNYHPPWKKMEPPDDGSRGQQKPYQEHGHHTQSSFQRQGQLMSYKINRKPYNASNSDLQMRNLNLENLISKAEWICRSIEDKVDNEEINQLIEKEKIKVTPNLITIQGMKDENDNYKVWAQYEREEDDSEVSRELIKELFMKVFYEHFFKNPFQAIFDMDKFIEQYSYLKQQRINQQFMHYDGIQTGSNNKPQSKPHSIIQIQNAIRQSPIESSISPSSDQSWPGYKKIQTPKTKTVVLRSSTDKHLIINDKKVEPMQDQSSNQPNINIMIEAKSKILQIFRTKNQNNQIDSSIQKEIECKQSQQQIDEKDKKKKRTGIPELESDEQDSEQIIFEQSNESSKESFISEKVKKQENENKPTGVPDLVESDSNQ